MVVQQIKMKSESHFLAALAASTAYKSVFNCRIRLPGSVGNPVFHADKCGRRPMNAHYCANVVL